MTWAKRDDGGESEEEAEMVKDEKKESAGEAAWREVARLLEWDRIGENKYYNRKTGVMATEQPIRWFEDF